MDFFFFAIKRHTLCDYLKINQDTLFWIVFIITIFDNIKTKTLFTLQITRKSFLKNFNGGFREDIFLLIFLNFQIFHNRVCITFVLETLYKN